MRHSLTVVSLLLLTSNAIAQEGYSAKSLFFAEDDSVATASTGALGPQASAQAKAQPTAKKPATQLAASRPAAAKPMGASYFIRIKNNDGSTRDVLATRRFKSGERFQLGVKVNSPTYVYILNEAPDGQVTQIYPSHGQNNFIDAMGTVFLPGQGAFEFDRQPGTEKLLVYLSAAPMGMNITEKIKQASPDIVPALYTSVSTAACANAGSLQANAAQEPERIAMAGSDSGYAAKGIVFKEEPTSPCASAPSQTEGYAAKGIVFSDDPEPARNGQVASYVVKKTSADHDRNLYLKLNLIHE